MLQERAQGEAPIAALLHEMLHETGYLEALEAERTIEAQGRMENLEELVNVAADSLGQIASELQDLVGQFKIESSL